MISLVFAFKVMIFSRVGHKLCKVMISLVFTFKVIRLGYQIRSKTVCKLMISLVFAFKVTVFIRLDQKLSVK